MISSRSAPANPTWSIEDGIGSGLLTADKVTDLFNAPEAFASAWETCLKTSPRLWHTIRQANGGWTGLGNVNSVFSIPGPVAAVSATSDGVTGETQFMFTTADGHLWHTIRQANGGWTGLGNVNSQL